MKLASNIFDCWKEFVPYFDLQPSSLAEVTNDNLFLSLNREDKESVNIHWSFTHLTKAIIHRSFSHLFLLTVELLSRKRGGDTLNKHSCRVIGVARKLCCTSRTLTPTMTRRWLLISSERRESREYNSEIKIQQSTGLCSKPILRPEPLWQHRKRENPSENTSTPLLMKAAA